MHSDRVDWVAGIVNYRSYGDLRGCLASLERQTRPAGGIVVVDHDPLPEEQARVAAVHPGAAWLSLPNRGYAAGGNAVLRWAGERTGSADFALLLNPDVSLQPDYAEVLIRELQRHPRAALAAGKLLRPDGSTIDSAGIQMPRHRRPRDRGAGRPDTGQFERCEEVFAVTGAAMMLRLGALPDLAVEGEVFDEDFFAYHEDTDLGWRAGLLGWHSLYVPEARALHGRRWRPEARYAIEPRVRRHSFANHYLEMAKNERLGPFLRDLPVIAAWEIVRLGFCLLRDRALLPGYADAARLLPRAWARRRVIQRRARERSAGAGGNSDARQ